MYINGEFVDDSLVRLEAARLKERMHAEMPGADELGVELKARDVARERVIERTLLRQAARKDPTPIPAAAVEAELNRYREEGPRQANCLLPRDQEALRENIITDLRLHRLFESLTKEIPKPTNKQIVAFYQSAKESLLLPETIHASHIVKNVDEATSESDALGAIRQIQSLLEQGVPFAQVADEHSDCPGRGGDLGFFARGEMVQEFEDAVFDLPVGTVSASFRTPFGFHIAKVHERRRGRIPPLNEVRGELEASIWRQERVEVIRAFTNDLRAHAEIRKSK